MKTLGSYCIVVVAVAAFLNVTGHATGKVQPRLAEALQQSEMSGTVYAWVFFTDKGAYEAKKGAIPSDVVSERSIQRRLKVLPPHAVVDYRDLPVDDSYVSEVASRVTRIRQRSKWFNAISVAGSPEQIRSLEQLPFVERLDLVARFPSRKPDAVEIQSEGSTNPEDHTSSGSQLDYGASFAQVNQINVPAIHDLGNYGQGVIVGVFDNGFRLLNHQVFSTMNILATYDFVDNKVSVVPNNPSPSFGSHGINTLSTIGGYRPGQLIGPAFGATYILARTENDSSETPAEEDNWVAGVEWMDSIGVDVTSTSLGYIDYDPPYTSWTWQNMDGNTTVITRAADVAVSRGIVVVNSAGNEGLNTSRNTLLAPSDGDSVIAVGAVNSNGLRSSFSSVGPTTSIPPRIKPDVMARGSSVVVASATNPSGYGTSSGTSFSCPLAAGVVALMLHANPSATPMEIVRALKSTASNSLSPNNLMGWGIVNAVAAIAVLMSNPGEDPAKPAQYRLFQNYPNPFNPTTTIRYSLPEVSSATLTIYNLLGQRIRTFALDQQSLSSQSVVWDGTDSNGSIVAGGAYVYRLAAYLGNSTVFGESKVMLLLR